MASGRPFELVDPADPRLEGRIARRLADDHWLWARGHATERLADQLNHHHRTILEEDLWERGDELFCAERRYTFAEPGELPDGAVCFGKEGHRSFVWLIEPGEMTPELMAVMNAWLADPDGGGRWRQHWQ